MAANHQPLRFELGVKSDPILYRYSYDWLFALMAGEGVRHLQMGTFFELYDLPDTWFRELRVKAADAGITISSIFTAHRELGGFFRDDGPGWQSRINAALQEWLKRKKRPVSAAAKGKSRSRAA